jgi:hypothetical protein
MQNLETSVHKLIYNILMPSNIEQLIAQNQTKINFESVLDQYGWIKESNQNCILSPDSDGLLCGLFMSHFLNWDIKGFYDGKVLVHDQDTEIKDCIFLDIEIFRKDIRSCGQHMLLKNYNQIPSNWSNFENCLQPNLLRNYDQLHNFRLKYPMATIHFLMALLEKRFDLQITKKAIPPLYFTDGLFNVLFSYPENVLNWLEFLRLEENNGAFRFLFKNDDYAVYELMKDMNNFFRQRDEISVKRERGDRLKISETSGDPCNLIETSSNIYKIEDDAVERITRFLKILSDGTDWTFKKSSWSFDNLTLNRMTKEDFNNPERNFNGPNYMDVLERNPISWAITSGLNMEYSFDTNNVFG